MGKAEYPNHHIMKRNRLIKLKKSKSKCEVCGETAYCIHHLDGSKDNHALENLAVICKKCHGILHSDRTNAGRKTSKYIRKYGMTSVGMAAKYGGSPSAYTRLDKLGQLQKFLDEQSKEEQYLEKGNMQK